MPPRIAAILALVCGAAITLLTGLFAPQLGEQTWALTYSYQNPLVIVMSLCVFSLVKELAGRRNSQESAIARFIDLIAPLTLGIYVIHPIFFVISQKVSFLHTLQMNGLAIPLTTVLAFAFSAVVTAVLLWIPLVRRAV